MCVFFLFVVFAKSFSRTMAWEKCKYLICAWDLWNGFYSVYFHSLWLNLAAFDLLIKMFSHIDMGMCSVPVSLVLSFSHTVIFSVTSVFQCLRAYRFNESAVRQQNLLFGNNLFIGFNFQLIQNQNSRQTKTENKINGTRGSTCEVG